MFQLFVVLIFLLVKVIPKTITWALVENTSTLPANSTDRSIYLSRPEVGYDTTSSLLGMSNKTVNENILRSLLIKSAEDDDKEVDDNAMDSNANASSPKRTVERLNEYIQLFHNWSVAFTSGTDLFLVSFVKKPKPNNISFGQNEEIRVVTTNMTLKPFFNHVLEELNREYYKQLMAKKIKSNKKDFLLSSASPYGSDENDESDNETDFNSGTTDFFESWWSSSSSASSSSSSVSLEETISTNSTRNNSTTNKPPKWKRQFKPMTFTRIQYHRETNNMIFLDALSGYLFTMNPSSLHTTLLRLNTKIIDFSICEDTNVMYYVAVKETTLVVSRLPLLIVNGNTLKADTRTINTVFTVYTTTPKRTRLIIDYERKSLFLFIVLRSHAMTYEQKLFFSDDKPNSLHCDEMCEKQLELSRSHSQFKIIRPWQNYKQQVFANIADKCETRELHVSRDRMLDVDFVCPTLSPRIQRMEVGRMYNWLKDPRRSNISVETLPEGYMFSSIIDDNSLPFTDSLPLRLIVNETPLLPRTENATATSSMEEKTKRRYESVKRLYVERIIYQNRCELESQTPYVRQPQPSVFIAKLDENVWNSVQRIDTMFIRQKELHNQVCEKTKTNEQKIFSLQLVSSLTFLSLSLTAS